EGFIMDSRHDEVKNFFRNHIPDFSSISADKAEELAKLINSSDFMPEHCYSSLFRSTLFIQELNSNYDQLAKCAGLAFSEGKINHEQIASLLEIIDIKRNMEKKFANDQSQPTQFFNIKIIQLLDEKNEFTKDAMNLFGDFKIYTPEKREQFKIEL